MNRCRLFTALLATAALILTSCSSRGDQGAAPEASPSPTETEGAQTSEVTLQMKARNNSGQEGTALLTSADGQIKVVLDLANSPGGPQPSHINRGSCDNLGETVHVLGGVRGGKLETTVQASLDSLLTGDFAVNVTKSPQEFGVSVSCAEIKR